MAELEIHVKRPIFGKDGKLIGILEMKVWKVPENKCHPEGYKYSLVFALYHEESGTFDGDFLRYDNHRCEGHHKHIRGHRFPYEFKDLKTLLEDFERDFKELLKEVEA